MTLTELQKLLGQELFAALNESTTIDPRRDAKGAGEELWRRAAGPLVRRLYSTLTTKGDLHTFGTANTRLGVGSNDYVLTADSSEVTGIKWAAVSIEGDVGTLQQVTDTGPYTNHGIQVDASGSYMYNLGITSGSIDMFGNQKIIHLPTPTADYDASTKKYVDDVSGSIGVDVNNQVLNLYDYVDDNIGASTDDLDDVAKRGSLTDHGIQVDASGSAFYNLGITSGSIDMFSNQKIIHLATPTVGGDAANKLYVDTVSGSIGDDLNNQVSNVREYVDTVSGSIGTEIAANYAFKDAVGGGSSSDTLDDVVTRGSLTDHGIQVDASGSFFYNLGITSGSIDMFSNQKIIHLATPTADYDAATKLYVDTVSGSIGDDLNNQVSNVREYVDTVSGSIGDDLNNQIHNTREYVDTVSGSIGTEIAANYAFKDAVGGGTPTFQEVTDVGATTDNDLTIAGLHINYHKIYINYDGPDRDSYIYFYEDTNVAGEYLKWDNVADRFYFSDGLYTNGDSIINGSLSLNGNKLTLLDPPTVDTDGATKLYVDTVSGSIGDDLNNQVSNVREYVDTVSGSIGDDLNNQVSNVREYTDTISGSIGLDLNNQVSNVREYTDTVSGSIGTEIAANYAFKSTTLDQICLNDNVSSVAIYADTFRTDSSATLQARFKSSSDSRTSLEILNTGDGYANIYFDGVDGDLAGGDYANFGQLNDGTFQFQLGNSAPSWAFAFKDDSATHVTVNRTGDILDVNGDALIQGKLACDDPWDPQDAVTLHYLDISLSGSTGENTSATLDDICLNDNVSSVAIYADTFRTDSSAALQARFESSSDTRTSLEILNTGDGYANIFFDGVDGNLSGGDYANFGQLNDGTFQFQIGSSAPSWAFDFKDDTTTHMTVNRTGDILDVNGDALIQGKLTAATIVHITPGSEPASGAEGDIYMDSTTHKLRVYNGSTWDDMN